MFGEAFCIGFHLIFNVSRASEASLVEVVAGLRGQFRVDLCIIVLVCGALEVSVVEASAGNGAAILH